MPFQLTGSLWWKILFVIGVLAVSINIWSRLTKWFLLLNWTPEFFMICLWSKFQAHLLPKSTLIGISVQTWTGTIYIGYPHLITVDSSTRYFQFKLSHNTLFLKSRLFHLNHVPDPLCSLCNNFNETPSHLFSKCLVVINLWNEVRAFFSPSINFDPLTPKSAFLGLFSDNDDLHLSKNHILLIFKICIYKNREKTLNKYTIITPLK